MSADAPLPIARALDPAWRDVLDAIARARRWPASTDVAGLGAAVARLSEHYNAGRRAPDALAARLSFSFPRDVPKAAAAVRELVALGALSLPADRPLRVLDLGAGLGAATWGIVHALSAQPGAKGRVEATLVDDESPALDLARAIVAARSRERGVELVVHARPGDVTRARHDAEHDLAIASQVLSEMHVDRAEAERVELHADWLARVAHEALSPSGSLVVIEPALHDRARHLHAVRDRLVARGELRVFAPCLHEQPCPALGQEAQWCHEDLPVDLPAWLVGVARAAGLRWQGLTFSYLVMRKVGDGLGARLGPRSLRIVSDPLVSKGKREYFACGVLGAQAAARARVMRLDRHASESNEAWDALARGDVFAVEPALDPEKPRILAEMAVDVRTPGR